MVWSNVLTGRKQCSDEIFAEILRVIRESAHPMSLTAIRERLDLARPGKVVQKLMDHENIGYGRSASGSRAYYWVEGK